MFRLTFFAVMLFSTASFAATCIQNNSSDCESLGYIQASCPNGGIACPYDKTKWHCAKWTCEDGRYSSTKKTSTCIAVTYKGMTCYDCNDGCSGYTLSSCPDHGICSVCGGKYKLDLCEDGYLPSLRNNSCLESSPITSCEDYPLSKCPDHAQCEECRGVSGTRYKFTKCDKGYYEFAETMYDITCKFGSLLISKCCGLSLDSGTIKGYCEDTGQCCSGDACGPMCVICASEQPLPME